MEVCYWALLFMPLVILHHLLNVFVQLANKRGFNKKKKILHADDVPHLTQSRTIMYAGDTSITEYRTTSENAGLLVQ
jgi:hypothetical protein